MFEILVTQAGSASDAARRAGAAKSVPAAAKNASNAGDAAAPTTATGWASGRSAVTGSRCPFAETDES